MSAPRPDEQPAEPRNAALVALGVAAAAWTLSFSVMVLFYAADPAAARTLGLVAGYGAFGVFAARAVPPFAGAVIGATTTSLRFALPVLLLVPAVLLVSEVDNVIASALPRPEGFGAGELAAGLVLLQGVLLGVLLEPLLAEFFYRGVLQSGCAAQLGAARGVAWVALLEALANTALVASGAYSALSGFAQALCWALLFGLLRAASGSLLPSIALRALAAGAGVAAGVMRDSFVIPGFNSTGFAHTPFVWLAPSAACVGVGVWWLMRGMPRR